MATFRNNKKKDWFSHEAGLIFMHSDIFRDESRNSAAFNMELLGLTTNVQYYLHVAVVTQPSLPAKLKFDENGHVLKAGSDTSSCFSDIVLHFFKIANYFLFH